MKNIVCFGEVLWDVFPNHKTIGGAPLNVALRLQSFGHKVAMITKIGKDALGETIFEYIKTNGVEVDYIQKDDHLKTGEVEVSLNEEGSATYVIHAPRAWDAIELTEAAKQITATSDAFIFGSLVARTAVSKATLYLLIDCAPYKIFDVNLRAPYYSLEELNYLMNAADFIKFNDDEIFEICNSLYGKSIALEECIRLISKQTSTASICVTLGAKGAVLFVDNEFYYNAGYTVNVIDTVGAGDAFLATLTHKLLIGSTPQNAINYACAVGAYVASQAGANPKFEKEDIEKLMLSI